MDAAIKAMVQPASYTQSLWDEPYETTIPAERLAPYGQAPSAPPRSVPTAAIHSTASSPYFGPIAAPSGTPISRVAVAKPPADFNVPSGISQPPGKYTDRIAPPTTVPAAPRPPVSPRDDLIALPALPPQPAQTARLPTARPAPMPAVTPAPSAAPPATPPGMSLGGLYSAASAIGGAIPGITNAISGALPGMASAFNSAMSQAAPAKPPATPPSFSPMATLPNIADVTQMAPDTWDALATPGLATIGKPIPGFTPPTIATNFPQAIPAPSVPVAAPVAKPPVSVPTPLSAAPASVVARPGVAPPVAVPGTVPGIVTAPHRAVVNAAAAHAAAVLHAVMQGKMPSPYGPPRNAQGQFISPSRYGGSNAPSLSPGGMHGGASGNPAAGGYSIGSGPSGDYGGRPGRPGQSIGYGK